MIKKSSESARESVFSARDFGGSAGKRIGIKQIRDISQQIRDLPEDAPLPDFSHLTIGDRLTVVAMLIPIHLRNEVMDMKSEYALPRYRAGTDIPVNVVAALAAETEIPIDWIINGKPVDRLAPVVYLSQEQFHADADDVPVQKLAFKAAAGRGELILDDLASHVRFPRAIIAQQGIAVQNARLMEAAGDSMRNTINDGDLLLIDISEAAKQIVEGKIYVFGLGNEAFVKRLRRTGDRVTMVSDNRDVFPPEDVPPHLPMQIFGRVKWSGRSH